MVIVHAILENISMVNEIIRQKITDTTYGGVHRYMAVRVMSRVGRRLLIIKAVYRTVTGVIIESDPR